MGKGEVDRLWIWWAGMYCAFVEKGEVNILWMGWTCDYGCWRGKGGSGQTMDGVGS